LVPLDLAHGASVTHELLNAEELQAITGKKRYSTQVAWFKENFGVDPVRRADGSIVLTKAAFELLLAKRMGVAPRSDTTALDERPAIRPPIRPVHKR
jgi:hypothetical protein